MSAPSQGLFHMSITSSPAAGAAPNFPMRPSHTNRHILGGETSWNHQGVKLCETDTHSVLDCLEYQIHLSTKRGGKAANITAESTRIRKELGFESYISGNPWFPVKYPNVVVLETSRNHSKPVADIP